MAEDLKNMEIEYAIELLKRFVVEHSQLTADKIVTMLDDKFSSKFISKDACEVRRKESEVIADKRFKLCITISLAAMFLALSAAGIKILDLMMKLLSIKGALGI